jgi:hypothetical protein
LEEGQEEYDLSRAHEPDEIVASSGELDVESAE